MDSEMDGFCKGLQPQLQPTESQAPLESGGFTAESKAPGEMAACTLKENTQLGRGDPHARPSSGGLRKINSPYWLWFHHLCCEHMTNSEAQARNVKRQRGSRV